jgi:hypothetical protein
LRLSKGKPLGVVALKRGDFQFDGNRPRSLWRSSTSVPGEGVTCGSFRLLEPAWWNLCLAAVFTARLRKDWRWGRCQRSVNGRVEPLFVDATKPAIRRLPPASANGIRTFECGRLSQFGRREPPRQSRTDAGDDGRPERQATPPTAGSAVPPATFRLWMKMPPQADVHRHGRNGAIENIFQSASRRETADASGAAVVRSGQQQASDLRAPRQRS